MEQRNDGNKEKNPESYINCKHFTGYRPCKPYKVCEHCADVEPITTRILIINLGGSGTVLMTTTILPKILRRYPDASIDWLTLPNAAPLLENLPEIHRIWCYGSTSRLILPLIRYDIAYNVDKDVVSAALMHNITADKKIGFGLDSHANLTYYNPQAQYLFKMGVDDELKFKINQRSGIDILAEALDLDSKIDEYRIELSAKEQEFVNHYRARFNNTIFIGINTGCSDRFPNKKMTITQHIKLCALLLELYPNITILLLGSTLEKDCNRQIAKALSEYSGRVVETPTNEGLRKGICYIDVCDIVVSGDTLGMHIAIALKKWVVAWFGLSCIQEVYLYDRGSKISANVSCSPCWKSECDIDLSCRDQINLSNLAANVGKGIEWLSMVGCRS